MFSTEIIRMNGVDVPKKEDVKYLDIHLDRYWREHLMLREIDYYIKTTVLSDGGAT